jgi:cytochrome b561
MFKNTEARYGLPAVLLHWVMAVLVIGLFALGLWMVDLTYYDTWYQTAPRLHEGLGTLTAALLPVRLVWRWMDPPPPALPSHTAWEHRLARATHWAFYLLLVAIPVSGYLISTAKGQPLDVFGLFEIPALVDSVENLEDTAGEVHEVLAWTLMALVVLHTLAALKHHLLERDETLLRIMGVGRRRRI